MEALIVFGSITAIVYFIVSYRYKERMEAIRKGTHPYAIGITPSLRMSNKSLFAGLVFCAIGLALIISSLFVLGDYDRDMMVIALVCLFGGAGMLVYWKLSSADREYARKMLEKNITKE